MHTANKEDPTQAPQPPKLLHVKSINRRGHEVGRAVGRCCRHCQCRCLPGTACYCVCGESRFLLWLPEIVGVAHTLRPPNTAAVLLVFGAPPFLALMRTYPSANVPFRVSVMTLCMIQAFLPALPFPLLERSN